MMNLTIGSFHKPLKVLHVPIVLLVWLIWLSLPAPTQAFEKQAEIKIPSALSPGLQHFLDQVDPDKNAGFNPRLVGPVLDFVESAKDAAALYYASEISDLASAYYDFDINRNLGTIVQYAFNPKIPSITTMQSSVRLFHQMDERLNKQPSPDVARYLDRLQNPVVFDGLLSIQITPDLNSGAYYSYNVYQTLLLFKHRGRKVLATVSQQTDVSTVGKKGYILGDDNRWDYYYSGKTGLTIPALGWVRSYMYDSSTINIYYEIDPGTPVVRCAMFRWLMAGWSGINMVQKKHIYRGLKRFAVPFKEILEYRQLPLPEVMADDFSCVLGLPEDALRSKMVLYSDMMGKRYGPGQPRSRKWPPDLEKNKNPWIDMSREEMESILVIEYMKYVLGKTPADEVQELLGLKR